MHVYFGASISQAFWRLAYPSNRRPYAAENAIIQNAQCANSASDLASKEMPFWFGRCKRHVDGAVDLLIFERSERRASATCKTQLWSGPLLPGSLCQAGTEYSITSPEFTFLLMARQLPLPQLIAYGDELCGTYSFDELSPRGMRQRKVPLTSRAELASFLDGAQGISGVKEARRAMQHIVDGSGSPMETVDEMLLCLPYRLGGYGLDIPEMNHEEPLSPMAASLAGRETVRFDLYWPDLGFAVEHQGEYDHNKKERYYDDRARIAGTRIAGYDLIELTGGICGKLNSIEQVALYIAKRQGKRIPKNALGETKQRAELRNGLFEWNRKWAPKNESQT